MAGIISTGSAPKLLWPGLNQIWGIAYNEYIQEWKELFEIHQSDKHYEEDVALSGTGLAPVLPDGAQISYDTMKQVFVTRYTHVAYALGYIITRQEIDDNLYDEFGKDRTIALARSLNQARENVGANVYNRAFNGSYTGGDGVSLLNTSHPTEAGVQSNKPDTDVDLSEAALEQAAIAIANFKDNRGNRIAIRPQKVIVPVQLQFEVDRILKNPLRPATAERDINALFQMNIFPEGFAVNHYLSDPDAWFVRTDCMKGMKYFSRTEPEFSSDNDFETFNAKFKAYARFSFGWTDWRALYGSQGA